MTLYHYTAVNRNGDKLVGDIEAISRDNVLEQLHKLGHFPVHVAEADDRKPDRKSARGGIFTGSASASQVTLFTRELAMLLKAGLPLDQALALLQAGAGSSALARLIRDIQKRINDGQDLQTAMAAQGRAFPQIYTNMVRVAEASGTLAAVLERIAEMREREQKIRSKAMSALIYPSLLIVTAIAAVTVMLTFVVPRFKKMILQAGAEVPESARIVIGASDWLLANWQALLIAIPLAGVGLVLCWRQTTVRRFIETALIRLPLTGYIMRLNLIIRFCRTLGTLLENGVELPSAVNLTRGVLGNRIASEVLGEAYESLRKGRSFLDPLEKSKLFFPVVINMLRVGEEIGGLDKSSLFMADMFEDKLETVVQRTFTILEPVIILVVSVFVAGIIISILGAVISINDLAI